MTLQQALAEKHDCACGKDHLCDIHAVCIADDALQKLPEITADFAHILLVADGNTYPLCGDRVAAQLGKKLENSVLFGCELLVPNENALAKIEAGMTEQTDLIVGIGSGVINDLCKYVAYLRGIRYVIVATAPSMDGYASVASALILQDQKITKSAAVPYAILAEPSVLSTAPIDMLRSGYGDIVGKYSCLNDWKLATLLRGEYFCDLVYDTMMQAVKTTEAAAEAILARDTAAIGALMESLVLVGVMISYVGNSRPASGSEHHFSHYFEITGLLNNKPYYLHGIDVLYSAAVTAKIREALLALEKPLPRADISNWRDGVRAVYSTAAEDIIKAQEKVGLYDTATDVDALEANWDAVCALLREAPGYEKMCNYVEAIGLNMRDFVAFYGEKAINDGLLYAKDLKDRFTVLWLAFALGIDSVKL